MIDLAMRDIEAAISEVETCRLRASQFRQMGLCGHADSLLDNAKSAEKWLVCAGRIYPSRCSALGRKV